VDLAVHEEDEAGAGARDVGDAEAGAEGGGGWEELPAGGVQHAEVGIAEGGRLQVARELEGHARGDEAAAERRRDDGEGEGAHACARQRAGEVGSWEGLRSRGAAGAEEAQ
jgi:hypothetical protein